MRVATELADDSGILEHGQVRGHHGHSASKIAEWRLRHQFIFELDQRRNAALHRPVEKS